MKDDNMIEFEFNNRKYPIKINHWIAVDVLLPRFDIDLLSMFTDEEKALHVMQRLILDDLFLLKLMHYFMDEDEISWEELLKKVEQRDLDRFREDFWRAVAAFTGPLKQKIALSMWKGFKKELKETDFENLTSSVSSTDSNPEE